ncbi:MAG: L,D-transpeptidase family protein [Alphaproteobacteria bacterium]
MQKLVLILMVFVMSVQLSGCSSMPTSERLQAVKARLEAMLRSEVKQAQLEYGSAAYIRIFKEERELEVWLKLKNSQQYALFRTYPICTYSGALGPKLQEGDKQAPEGFYKVGAEQLNPWSQYHLSFNLGFPNNFDRALGRTGSLLMVHGGCESIGCYAMTDSYMEDIYLLTEASIANGHDVPVHIFPFRMEIDNMLPHRESEWLEFWINLKQGYDLFERYRIPPRVGVQTDQFGAKYVFDMPAPSRLF